MGDPAKIRQSSSETSVSFTRHVREIFIVLIALVAASNFSGLFLLDRVIHEEETGVDARLTTALDQIRPHHPSGFPATARPADLTSLAGDLRLIDLQVGFAVPNHGDIRWRVLRSTQGESSETSFAALADTPQMPKSGWTADGEYWQYMTISTTWNGQLVVVCAAVPATGLGGLLRQFRQEIWVRGFIVVAFILFAVLFHRIVLRPFRDMRRRAAALVDSGLLPEAKGQPIDDPEYVIWTFDVLVRELIDEADVHRQRAVQSETRARNVERFNEYMLRSMSTGVLILGHDGVILRANRAAERILHASGCGLVGRHFTEAELYPEMIALIEEGLRYGQMYSRREMRIERPKEEEPIFLGANTSLIRDEFDDVVGLSLLLTDLTEIKRLYDNLTENQRLADLGEMTASLAHQLRNSMAAILGYARLLRQMSGSDERSMAWADSVIGEAQETSQMLERFLSFARPLSGDRSPVDLENVITEAIETMGALARESGVHLAFQSPGDRTKEYEVLGDQLLLRQVFINLIQNAIEAMPSGGNIEIRMGDLLIPAGDPPRARLSEDWPQYGGKPTRRDHEATIRVEVIDQGTGITEGDRTRIFRPLFTSKETGTGLGLTLAKKIAVFHGGSLILERSGPEGSTFVVTLPAQRTKPAALESAEYEGAASPLSSLTPSPIR